MAKYIKCPRCELNYIDPDEQEFCDVCLAELAGEKLKFADLEEEDEVEQLELCPVCGVNYMKIGAKMCEDCRAADSFIEDEEEEEEEDVDSEWRSYLDDDAASEILLDDVEIVDDDLFLGDGDLYVGDDDFSDEFEDEEVEPLDPEPDDFDESLNFDDLPDDDDDDDDDEEDEDDDF